MGIPLPRQEPVDVAAVVADDAGGLGIDPVEVEERRDRRVQLPLPLPEPVVMADLASKGLAGDLDLARLLLAEESHARSSFRLIMTGKWNPPLQGRSRSSPSSACAANWRMTRESRSSRDRREQSSMSIPGDPPRNPPTSSNSRR